MNPGVVGSTADYPSDVLGALASGLAADTTESGRKTLEVVRARSPELILLSEETGEDLVATSAGFIDMLLASLRSDVELPWAEYDDRSRSYGRLRAAQGVPLESLMDVLAVYRRATVELISVPLQQSPRRDEIFAIAQSRLENVAERLTTSISTPSTEPGRTRCSDWPPSCPRWDARSTPPKPPRSRSSSLLRRCA
jgi:hypothetical protein